jgi:hypothetical protein
MDGEQCNTGSLVSHHRMVNGSTDRTFRKERDKRPASTNKMIKAPLNMTVRSKTRLPIRFFLYSSSLMCLEEIWIGESLMMLVVSAAEYQMLNK